MKRLIAAASVGVLLLTPTAAFAHRDRRHNGFRGGGGAVAWGILGGIVGGVVLDRVLFPPPVIVREPAYYPRAYGSYSPPPYYYEGTGYRPRSYGYGGYAYPAPRPRCHDDWYRGYRD